MSCGVYAYDQMLWGVFPTGRGGGILLQDICRSKKKVHVLRLTRCSDEQKSSKKNLVKFGARNVSVCVARAPAVNNVK